MDYTGTYSGLEDVISLSDDARTNAYAPFNEPDEGAVVVTEDGYGVVGSRIENSNFTNTIHAVETALGDLLSVDDAPAYLAVSTDELVRPEPDDERSGSFLKSRPQQLYEFVDGDFPVIVHEDDTVAQYTVDEIVSQSGADGLKNGDSPDELPAFEIEAPYTMIGAENAVNRIDTWRDAAYKELRDRLSSTGYTADDPMDDVMQAAKDAMFAVDEKPGDVLADLWDYAQDAQDDAYEPISDYPVGVSLLDRGGRVFTGQNMEFADISNTMHGEGSALSTAVTWGLKRDNVAMVNVHSESDAEPFPCGLCRQTLSEFADADTVLGALGKDDSDVEAYSTLGWHNPDMFRL